ncbi:MAG: DedA family protein [Candidatus Omnitrophica bacterium]|nr:DedA family protein [Candidatus Omnitrophota bacterium]
MNIEQWLEQFGYLAVFIGVFFEGPLTLALAGFLAYQGYLSIIAVLLTAFIATFLYIEIVFFIGMGIGRYLMNRWPVFRRYYGRISALLERYEKLFILFFRFVYGAHTFAPLVVGMGRVKPAYFTMLNTLGAAIWTITLFLIGYFFGHVFKMLIEDIKHYEKLIALFLVAVMLVYYLIRRLIWRKMVVDKN